MSGIVKSFVGSQLQGTAEDYVMEKFNAFAGKRFQCKDPFRDAETNSRLKLPEELNPTKEDMRFWRHCQNKAWRDDKCLLSMCGFYMSCGCLSIGTCPLVVLIPAIGPLTMYYVHSKLIEHCKKKRPGMLSDDKIAKMYANIVFDLMIALPPVLGFFFTWMNGCSTRNCAIIYTEMCKELESKMEHEPVIVESVQVSAANNYARVKK